MSTQYTVFWCFFHALCMYCAWRGALLSIVSGSLWFLSTGFTSRKNTVCLLLKFWPPGIKPELMMECQLIAHPTWWMYLKTPSGIMTLSCNEGSIRLRPEWPWRARRYKIIPEESVQYWYIFFCPPPPAMLLFHFSSDQWWQYKKWFWRWSLCSRSQSLHHCLEVDYHVEEDGSISSTLENRRANVFLVQHQSKSPHQ